jgi:hypothetical protein
MRGIFDATTGAMRNPSAIKSLMTAAAIEPVASE